MSKLNGNWAVQHLENFNFALHTSKMTEKKNLYPLFFNKKNCGNIFLFSTYKSINDNFFLNTNLMSQVKKIRFAHYKTSDQIIFFFIYITAIYNTVKPC